MVPRAGLEPAQLKKPRDFKSLVSTNSTTRAGIEFILVASFLILPFELYSVNRFHQSDGDKRIRRGFKEFKI